MRKVVNGIEVDNANFLNEYIQNSTYQIIIDFSPAATALDAFGEVLLMNADSSSIMVSGFEIEIAQQDAYFDNIQYQ